MNDCSGKRKRCENESGTIPKRQDIEDVLQFSPSCEGQEEQERLVSETIEQNEVPSNTTLYQLPLEILDIILQKSYLHLNSKTNGRDEDVIRSLMSVDVCFRKRITRRRFRRAIRSYLKVEYPISIKFTHNIEVRRNEFVRGVTKLRNEIYVLCELDSDKPHVIRVFEDRNKFCLQREIEIKAMKDPWEIGSSEKENCLYVIDFEERCVWKITRETDDEYKIIKFLTTDYQPSALSVSSDGQLLVVNHIPSILMIYGSDAELIRSIQLPWDQLIHHAVKTSVGNFIVIHHDRDEEEVEEDDEEEEGQVDDWTKEVVVGSGSNGRNSMKLEKREEGKEEEKQRMKEEREITTVKTKRIHYDIHVGEWTEDGQMILRRFTIIYETQHMYGLYHLSLDSNDRVFVFDFGNRRVILLDSDLKWNRILCPTKEETEETRIGELYRMYYDEEKKQLIVVEDNGIYLYTLNRN